MRFCRGENWDEGTRVRRFVWQNGGPEQQESAEVTQGKAEKAQYTAEDVKKVITGVRQEVGRVRAEMKANPDLKNEQTVRELAAVDELLTEMEKVGKGTVEKKMEIGQVLIYTLIKIVNKRPGQVFPQELGVRYSYNDWDNRADKSFLPVMRDAPRQTQPAEAFEGSPGKPKARTTWDTPKAKVLPRGAEDELPKDDDEPKPKVPPRGTEDELPKGDDEPKPKVPPRGTEDELPNSSERQTKPADDFEL